MRGTTTTRPGPVRTGCVHRRPRRRRHSHREWTDSRGPVIVRERFAVLPEWNPHVSHVQTLLAILPPDERRFSCVVGAADTATGLDPADAPPVPADVPSLFDGLD